jgi:hypothetical protein
MANDLRNVITVETQGIEQFLAFTKKAKSELLAIKKIMMDKGFKGGDSDALKMAAAYRREMLKAIQDVGKANSKMLLGAMNAQKNSLGGGGKSAKNDAQIRELEIAIAVVKELTKATNESKKAVDSLEKSISDLNKEQLKTAKVKKEVVQLTQAELVQLEAEKIKKRENTLIAKQNAIIQTQEKDTIASLRAQLSLTSIQWAKLTQEEIENTDEGRRLNAEKTRLTAQLKKLEKATGDHRREVGNYTLAGNKAASMVSRLGLAGNKLTGVFGRVGRALDNFGLGAFALAAAGATIAWQFFADNFITNTDEIIEKNNELKESIAGLTDTLAQGQREGKLFQIDNSNLSEAEKRLAKINFLKEEFGRIGVELGEANRKGSEAQSIVDSAIFKTELEKNEATEKALKLANEGNRLALELAKIKSEISAIEGEGDKAAQEASKKRKEDAAKRIEDEKKFAAELLKIQSDRLKDEEDLANALIQLQIEAIEDVTEKAIAAEIERNRLQQDATADNFSELRKQRLEELEKVKEFLGEKSEEYLRFEVETYNEINSLRTINNSISAQQERDHQAALQQIKDDAAQASLDKEKAFAQRSLEIRREEISETEKLWEEYVENNEVAENEQIEKDVKTAKDRAQATEDAIISSVQATFDGVQKIMKIAADAENKAFDDAINQRQERIDALNDDLQTATGAQRVFLEKQIAQEKAAQKTLKDQADKARKEQAEAQKAVAIVQAIVNTALAVTQALGSAPPPASFALAAAAGVAGAIEIATIAASTFEKGGVIEGKSHKQGGVRASVKGAPDVELEGGEIIINKNSARMYRKELSNINVMGGGRKFQFGGDVSPNFQAIASANNGEQRRAMEQITNAQIFVNVTDISNMQQRVANVVQKSSI